jgi:glutamate dehydrogenase/leucine dehydrogenase
MAEKAALAGLAYGGGKTVVALQEATAAEFTGPRRGELLADVADLVESFGGRYITGPDIGTSPQDMAVLRQRTAYALCLPESAGGPDRFFAGDRR